MKSCDIKHALWPKASHKDIELIMRRRSLVMDATTFRYLIYLEVFEGLDMRLMDVVTTYLYGSIDTNVYMKISEGFKLLEIMNSKLRSMYSIKLQ